MKDGEESDTNCRSSYYPPCALGGACNLVGDCQMGLCSVDSTPVYVSQPTPVGNLARGKTDGPAAGHAAIDEP